MMFVRLSVRMCVTGVHCDRIRCMLARIIVYGWIVQCSEHPDTKACPPIPSHLSPVPSGIEVGIDKCKLSMISQERLKIEVKLLLSANRKSCRVDW